MASKEATAFIIDIGKSMNRKNSDRDDTDLEWSLKYFWDKLTHIVSSFFSF
jgi:ATP-dependent DNA helicase 2 subunit 2